MALAESEELNRTLSVCHGIAYSNYIPEQEIYHQINLAMKKLKNLQEAMEELKKCTDKEHQP